MKKPVKRGLFVLLVLALVIGVAVTLLYKPARNLAQLTVRDEQRQLTPVMRPEQGRKVLVIALDGVGAGQFQKALATGMLPTLAQYMGGTEHADGVYPHAYSAKNVLSILPSTTLAAWSATWTGKPAGQNGVPGNEWFERESMTFLAPAPVSLSTTTDTVRMLTDDLVGRSLMTYTLFERADRKSFVSLSAVYRGADMFTAPGSKALLGLMSDAHKIVSPSSSSTREAYSEIDDESAEVVVENLEKNGLPDLQVLYFPGVDLFTHEAERPLEDQLEYIRETLDHSIAQVLAVYLKKGSMQDTTILIVADHGHTPVLADDRHALGTVEPDEPTAILERAGFRLREKDRAVEEDEKDFQAVVAYQGAMAYVYLADRSTCAAEGVTCNWKAAPRLKEDVLTAARAFYESTQKDGPIPELRGTLDLIFARQPVPVGEDAKPFQIFDGEKLVPISEYLAAHPRPDLVNLEERMNGLSSGPYGHRAGDVLLLAKSSALDPIDERFYFSNKPYTSWHGSPSAQDSTIPLVVIRKSASGAELKAELERAVGASPSQLSVTPLVMKLLQGPEARARDVPAR